MRFTLVSTATSSPTSSLHRAKATKNSTMAMMGVSSGAMTSSTSLTAMSGAPLSSRPAAEAVRLSLMLSGRKPAYFSMVDWMFTVPSAVRVFWMLVTKPFWKNFSNSSGEA